MASRILVIIALFVIISIIVLSMMTYASSSQYRSYTRTIKTCGSDGCVMRDFLVQCLGDAVLDIKPIGVSTALSDNFSDDIAVWC